MIIENENEYRLAILREMVNFCEREGITYSLAWGSLWGAIREGGIIPWDYDIDVMMPRPDYDRFVSLFPSDEGRYQLWCPENNLRYKNRMGIVVDTQTRCCNLNLPVYHSLSCLAVEVYPIDGLPAKGPKRERYLSLLLWAAKVNRVKMAYWSPTRSRWKNAAVAFIRRVCGVIPDQYIIERVTRGCAFAMECDAGCGFADERVQRLQIPGSCFTHTHFVEFEGVRCRIIDDYDLFLSEMYGDYMTPPPVEEIEKSRALAHECTYEFVANNK